MHRYRARRKGGVGESANQEAKILEKGRRLWGEKARRTERATLPKRKWGKKTGEGQEGGKGEWEWKKEIPVGGGALSDHQGGEKNGPGTLGGGGGCAMVRKKVGSEGT